MTCTPVGDQLIAAIADVDTFDIAGDPPGSSSRIVGNLEVTILLVLTSEWLVI